MKSDQVRTNWRDALEAVRQGDRIIIEHYNRPVAMLVPYAPQEPAMTMTSHDLRDQIVRYLNAGAHGGDFDADAIVEAIITGYGVVDIDTIDAADFNAILEASVTRDSDTQI